MFYPSNTVEKNFDDLLKGLEITKNKALSQIGKLQESTNIKKVRQFSKLPIEINSIQLRENNNSYFSNSKEIVFWINKDTYKALGHKINTSDVVSKDSWDGQRISITVRESNEEKLEAMKNVVKQLAELSQPIHEENIKVLENNKAIEDNIFYILDQAGISRTYYDYKTRRSSQKSKMYYSFPSEIRKQIPTGYDKDLINKLKDQHLKKIDELWNKEMKLIRAEREEKERIEREKENNKKLALLLAKYDLELENDWDDILYAIITKDKYLYLAHYLERNRGDWNSGCSFARSGLDGFTIESELDQKIYNDIQNYIDNWDRHLDGRVFRDCEYNYSVLFGMVEESKPDLMKDYSVVKENIDFW